MGKEPLIFRAIFRGFREAILLSSRQVAFLGNRTRGAIILQGDRRSLPNFVQPCCIVLGVIARKRAPYNLLSSKNGHGESLLDSPQPRWPGKVRQSVAAEGYWRVTAHLSEASTFGGGRVPPAEVLRGAAVQRGSREGVPPLESEARTT